MQNKENGENKNLPALISSFSLTEEESNLVTYQIKGLSGELFCAGVTVINGWVTMTNLRVKTISHSSVKFLDAVSWYGGGEHFDNHFTMGDNDKVYSAEGYDVIASRTISAESIAKVDSFDQEQHDLLPLWCRTSKEQAIEKANERVVERNKDLLVSNRLKFSYFVRCYIERQLGRMYMDLPRWQRNGIIFGWFAVDKFDWIREQRKQPVTEELKQEAIEGYKAAFNKKNVPWEGTLEYNDQIAEELFNRHGIDLRKYLITEHEDL